MGFISRLPGEASVAEHDLDPATRAAFADSYTKHNVALLRQNIPVVVFLLLLFVVWDVLISSAHAYQTTLVRLVIVLSFLLAFLGTSYRSLHRFHDAALTVLLFISGFGIAFILYIIPDGFEVGIAGVALTIMGVSGFFRLPGRHTLVGGFAVAAAMVGLMVLKSEPIYLMVSNAMFVLSFLLFGVIVNVQTRRDALSIYLYQQRLENEKSRSQALVERITGMRQDRVEWLENLARFLQHELQNQLVAADTSLALMGSGKDGAETYVERARGGLDSMRRLIATATEATSLEAALTIERMDRLDLSGFLLARTSPCIPHTRWRFTRARTSGWMATPIASRNSSTTS